MAAMQDHTTGRQFRYLFLLNQRITNNFVQAISRTRKNFVIGVGGVGKERMWLGGRMMPDVDYRLDSCEYDHREHDYGGDDDDGDDHRHGLAD